jgi:glycolate oxidase FAD binding subunit
VTGVLVRGLAAAAIHSPANIEDLSAFLRGSKGAVVPVGGGTRLGLGGALRAESFAAVDLTGLNRVIDHAVDDMTITVEPGITLAELSRVLAAHGQWIPLDPPFPERATAGGMVATAAWGPLRPFGETPRRHLIGIAVLDGGGRLIRAGGRVVKNVAGYDLMKLHSGALGTLGVLVELTFRVKPLPEAEVLLLGLASDLGAVAGLAGKLNRSDLEPSVFLVYDSGTALEMHGDVKLSSALGLVIGFLGFQEDVTWCAEQLERLAGEEGIRLEHRLEGSAAGAFRATLRLNPASGEVELRAAGPPSRTFDLLRALEAPRVPSTRDSAGPLRWFLAHPSLGVVRVLYAASGSPEARDLVAARRAVEACGGRMIVEACPDSLAREAEIWGSAGSGFELMSGLKDALDPDRRFNPGRFAGGL